MIVKFDHISFSCTFAEEEMVVKDFTGYEEVFSEKNLCNLEIKEPFLRVKQDTHNIFMLQKENCYPVEITSYAQCQQSERRLNVEADRICIKTADVELTEQLYKSLGFRGENGILEYKPLLDSAVVKLQIIQDSHAPTTTCLDDAGYGILAFVVDNSKKQKKQLEEAGFAVTEIQELTVNEKPLKICFAKSKAGDLIELIGIR